MHVRVFMCLRVCMYVQVKYSIQASAAAHNLEQFTAICTQYHKHVN